MPTYLVCEQCARGVHRTCEPGDDCACLACRYPTDEQIADAPTTGETVTAPDDEDDERHAVDWD